MGSRGAMLEGGGFSVPHQWETVDVIDGYKVIEPKDKSKKPNLPYVSNKPNDTYVKITDGKFSQIRKYGSDRLPVYDIDYGWHGDHIYLHIHYFVNERRLEGNDVFPLNKGDSLYEKYKHLFIGI